MSFSALNGDKFRGYTTIEGDRWSTIAEKAYGDATKFDPIIQCNYGFPLNPIFKGGIKLRIPVIQDQDETANEDLPPWFANRNASTEQARAAVAVFNNPSVIRGSTGNFDIVADWVEPYNYMGRAVTGSPEDAPIWFITRIEITEEGHTIIKHATAVKWTERLTATYL
jgi:hypothetical protein